jgi:2-hydroxyglutarate dehydrogenase
LNLIAPYESIYSLIKGFAAIHSPYSGIIDWKAFTELIGEEFKSLGGTIIFDFALQDVKNSETGVILHSKDSSIPVDYVLTCCGTYSDRVALLTSKEKYPIIIPFKGEYMLLNQDSFRLNGLIYPVPNPKFPFLGVHFTKTVYGKVIVGPNALLSFSKNYNTSDSIDVLKEWPFYKLLTKYASFGLREYAMSFDPTKRFIFNELLEFTPGLNIKNLQKTSVYGIRAQAVHQNGSFVDDFVFDYCDGTDYKNKIVHVRNAPSPGATSSMAIAEHLVETISKAFKL